MSRTFALWALPALLIGCSGGDDGDDGDDTSSEVVDCSTRPTAIPTARGEVEGAYSPQTQQFLFFGGDEGVPVDCFPNASMKSDTWVWEEDCQNWRLTDAEGPTPTARYAAGYDPLRDRFIIYGGRFREGSQGAYTLRKKTWAYNFAKEEWKALPVGPDARAIAAGVVAGDRFVVHGGTGSSDGASFTPLYDETWILDLENNTWEQLATQGGPGARIFHSLASDGGDIVWLFGGGDENAFTGPFYNDMWQLDLSTGEWTELHDGRGPAAPAGRIGHDILFDEANNRLIVWSGHDITDLGNSNQLYTFDLGSNSYRTVREGDVVDAGANGFCDFPADFVTPEEGSPERRYLSASALTPDGRMYTFGGKTDCGIINDLWTFDFAADEWTNLVRATDGETCLRAYDNCESLCF